MNFLSRWRIGRRLGLAFAVVVALTVVSAAFSQIRLSEIQARLAHDLTVEQQERTALVYHWRSDTAINANRAQAMVALVTDADARPSKLLGKIMRRASADSGVDPEAVRGDRTDAGRPGPAREDG